jgi:hypothetical protein
MTFGAAVGMCSGRLARSIMAKSKMDIIADIDAHVAARGGSSASWYVGITKDVELRLFDQHNIKKTGGLWIYREAYSAEDARDIKAHFLLKGFDGGAGAGDDDSAFVYAYKKTSTTDP